MCHLMSDLFHSMRTYWLELCRWCLIEQFLFILKLFFTPSHYSCSCWLPNTCFGYMLLCFRLWLEKEDGLTHRQSGESPLLPIIYLYLICHHKDHKGSSWPSPPRLLHPQLSPKAQRSEIYTHSRPLQCYRPNFSPPFDVLLACLIGETGSVWAQPSLTHPPP